MFLGILYGKGVRVDPTFSILLLTGINLKMRRIMLGVCFLERVKIFFPNLCKRLLVKENHIGLVVSETL